MDLNVLKAREVICGHSLLISSCHLLYSNLFLWVLVGRKAPEAIEKLYSSS